MLAAPEIGFKSSSITIASARSDHDGEVDTPPPFTVRLVNGPGGQPMTRGSSSRLFSGSTYHGSPEASRDEYLDNKQAIESPPAHAKESNISLSLVLLLLAIVTVVWS